MPLSSADAMAVRASPLFANLPDESVARILDGASAHHFGERTILVRAGDSPEHLYVPLSGFIGFMVADSRGNDYAVDFLMPGRPFVVAAVILDRPYLLNAHVLQESRIVTIPAAVFRRHFEKDLCLAVASGRELAHNRSGAVVRVRELLVQSPIKRVATFLLQLSENAGGATTVTMPCDRRILAGWLGVVPASAARVFRQLEGESLVKTRGRQVTIASVERLREFSRT
jgi:CRP/FNR family transcriptional activator FtrB